LPAARELAIRVTPLKSETTFEAAPPCGGRKQIAAETPLIGLIHDCVAATGLVLSFCPNRRRTLGKLLDNQFGDFYSGWFILSRFHGKSFQNRILRYPASLVARQQW